VLDWKSELQGYLVLSIDWLRTIPFGNYLLGHMVCLALGDVWGKMHHHSLCPELGTESALRKGVWKRKSQARSKLGSLRSGWASSFCLDAFRLCLDCGRQPKVEAPLGKEGKSWGSGCFVLGDFKTANPLWTFPGEAQRCAEVIWGAALEIDLLTDSQMNSSSLALHFLRIRQTDGSRCPRSQRAVIELRVQKAIWNYFKP